MVSHHPVIVTPLLGKEVPLAGARHPQWLFQRALPPGS